MLKNNPTNLIFWSLLSAAAVYLASIFILIPKILSSAIMQFLFLWQYHYVLPSIFWPNIIGGLFMGYALILLFRSSILVFLQIIRTRRFLASLSLTPQASYLLFSSSTISAFTAGFFHPQIYLSTSLVDKCTALELSAIILHESGHQANSDPLRDLLINFTKNFLPVFPGKSSLYSRYFTATEITADALALHQVGRRSLVSALVKVLKTPLPTTQFSLNYFSGSRQRFLVLIGSTDFSVKKSFIGSFTFTVLVILATTQLFNSSLFVGCQHLLDCFKSITKPLSVHPIVNNLPHCHDDQYVLHL